VLAAAGERRKQLLALSLGQAEQRGTVITQVAGFNRWKDLGRIVRRGERAYGVLAPLKRRLSLEEAQAWQAQGKRGFEGDGRPALVIRGWRIESVFDVAQTDALPGAPELVDGPRPEELHGTGPDELWQAVERLIVGEGWTLHMEAPSTPGAYGSASYSEKVVRIRPDIDRLHQIKTEFHEIAHIRANHGNRSIGRDQRECEAESVAYVILAAHDLESVGYSAPYVAGWSGGDFEVIQAAATEVHRVARSILDDLGDGES
jgi:hypothetical protein